MTGDYFNQLPVFQGLTKAQMDLIRPLVRVARLTAGKTIFEQGEQARYLYVLINGEVTIRYKPYDGPALVVAQIRAGGVFGWSAALGHVLYTSSATCDVEGKAYRINNHDLRTLCEQHPDTGSVVLDRLAANVAQRVTPRHGQVVNILSQAVDRDENNVNQEAP